MSVEDLTGQRFGMWKVRRRAENSPLGLARFLCLCDCGTLAEVRGTSLRTGISTRCRACAAVAQGAGRRARNRAAVDA